MQTIPEVTRNIIIKSLFLQEALEKGIINYSALARLIKPEVEKKLLKKVETGALIMGLKRMHSSRNNNQNILHYFDQTPEMIVRSNLVEYTFPNSATILTYFKQIVKELKNQHHYFVTLTQGVFESGIIFSKELEGDFQKILKDHIAHRSDNLSSITINLPDSNVATPGLYYYILKALAWENINIIEIVSTYHELTLVFDTRMIDNAFSCLKNALSNQND